MRTQTTLQGQEHPIFKLTVVFSTLFLDFFAFAAVIPLVPLLLLEPSSGLLPPSYSLQLRCILLGILYSAYPLAQMLFSPLLGAFSDKFGRRAMLITAYVGNTLGYLLFALGIRTALLPLLLAGYFAAGATGCNIATTQTIVADIGSSQDKLRRFSLSNLLIGLAFVLGPLLSGRSVAAFPAIAQLAFLAFLGCSLISLCNAALVFTLFKNPFDIIPQQRAPLLQLRSLFRTERELFPLFAGAFLLFFGWFAFIKFFQAVLLGSPHFQELEIFSALSYFGLCCVVTQFFFSLYLHRLFMGRHRLLFLVLLFAAAILATAFVTTYLGLMTAVTLFSIAYSILCSCLMHAVSERSRAETRGRTLGIYQSIQDMAKIAAPLFSGYTMALTPSGPVLIATAFILSSLAVFYWGDLTSRKVRTEQDSNL